MEFYNSVNDMPRGTTSLIMCMKCKKTAEDSYTDFMEWDGRLSRAPIISKNKCDCCAALEMANKRSDNEYVGAVTIRSVDDFDNIIGHMFIKSEPLVWFTDDGPIHLNHRSTVIGKKSRDSIGIINEYNNYLYSLQKEV